jgi:hypothetical protein
LLYFPYFARDGPNGETDERNATHKAYLHSKAKRSSYLESTLLL